MGRLSGFLSGFTGSLAGQLKEGRDAKRKAEEDAAQFKMQLSYAKAAAAMQHNMKAKTEVPIPAPYGTPIQRGPGNWEQPTKLAVPALLDETTGDVVRAPELQDGPFMPTTDPNALTPYQSAQLDQKALDRESRIEAARIRGARSGSSRAEVGEDGLTPYQREQLKRTDAREARLGQSKSGGGMTEKGWREGMDATLSSIQGADAGKLKSMIRQYGGDNIMTGDMDENMLREAAFSVAETYWNERKPSGKKASEPGKPDTSNDEEAAAIKEARQAIERGAPESAVLARLRAKFPKATI